LLGRPLQKKPMLRRFKSDPEDIWHDCSRSKYTSIGAVGFLMRRHNFKIAGVTSFHSEKCCHLWQHSAHSSWFIVHSYLFGFR